MDVKEIRLVADWIGRCKLDKRRPDSVRMVAWDLLADELGRRREVGLRRGVRDDEPCRTASASIFRRGVIAFRIVPAARPAASSEAMSPSKRRMQPGWAWGLIAILTMGALLAATVVLTTREDVTDFELGLLQLRGADGEARRLDEGLTTGWDPARQT